MNLQLILLVGFGGAIVTYFAGKVWKALRELFAVIFSLILVGMIIYVYNRYSDEILKIGFLNFNIVFRLNALSWLFAIMISGITFLSILFSLKYIKGRENLNFYYAMLLLVNASMLGIVFAGDLISFYIFWEIMSWSTFLLISYNKGKALNAGLKYIIMSLVGSMAILIGIILLYLKFGSLDISFISANINTVSTKYIIYISSLFFIGFGVKSAIVPLHTWLPDAHSEAPSPFSAILSGILIKMGIYGFIIILYIFWGIKIITTLNPTLNIFTMVLSIIGALTIVIPTFIALLQNDAKRLLAWHSVGQMGYIILGISFGTSLGLAGGIFHIINHASFKALLFLTVGAVEYRTQGVRDLNSLGGFIKKMPVTFITALIGALGIIGVPLTNGFVSKWLIYKSSILEGHPFLAFAALIGTWGTILSFYKFIHNIFLGQLPRKYENIKKAPFSMQLPLIILSVLIILFGILPGIPLKVINAIGISFGLKSLNVTIWGIASDTGTLNTINIFSAVLVASIVVWLFFRIGKKSKKVPQESNYAAGSYIPEGKYHYTVEFYGPLYRMIAPYLRDVIDDFYNWLAERIKVLCNGIRKIYTGDVGIYVLYILFFLALLIFIYLRQVLW